MWGEKGCKGIIMTVVALTLTLAGCGQRKEANKIILRYSTYSDVTYNKFREDKIKEFEKLHPGVVVKFEPIFGPEYAGKILTQIAGGIAPDVFFTPDYFYMVRKNTILDLTPYIEQDKEFYKEIYPVLMEYHRYNGKIYGIPGNLNIDVMYYNKGLFDANGLNYPNSSWTWETMLEAAKKLTKRESNGRAVQFGIVMPGTYWVWYILQNGAEIWDKDRNEFVINSPGAVEAVNFMKDLSKKHYVSPLAGDMIGGAHSERDMFIMGKIAIFTGGRYYTTYFKKLKNLEWRIAPVPKGKKRVNQLTFNTLAVSATTKHPEMAYQLAKFLITPEAIRFLVNVGDSIPIRHLRKSNDYFLDDPTRPEGENKVYPEAMKYASTLKDVIPPELGYDETQVVMTQEYELFYIGRKTADEMLESIEQKLNEMINRK